MKGSAIHLIQLLEGSKKRFIIPVYQRNYDWKKDNCVQLFDDLKSLVLNNKPSHFFGSIVYSAHGLNEVVIIDGQQRITTISILMIAMVNAMKKGLCVPHDENLAEYIEESYIIDKFQKENRKVRLKPFRDDCEAFDKLIYSDEEDYVPDSKVTINYKYFYDRITQKQEMTMDELFHAIESLIIISIELEVEHGDNPQLIFESLNSTGLDLTEADKIRNFILMDLSPDVQEQYYDQYWNRIEKCCGDDLDSFVRNYLTIQTGSIPTLKNVYQEFKSYTHDKSNVETILQSMLKYALIYKQITSFKIGGDAVNSIARRLDLLDLTVAYPFLMVFLDYANNEKLPESEVEKVLSCIEIFIFRRLICDYPTNALNKIFATLHKTVLKAMRENDSYSSVMVYILENRRQASIFPKNEEFTNAFVTKNIYSMKAKNKEYIFDRLENMNSKERHEVVGCLEDGKYSVEHIMPQTLTPTWMAALGDKCLQIHEKWLHTIANLTLTAYNSKYSNRPFVDKKTMEDGFIDSGLKLNQYIAGFDKWTEEELMLREENLLEKAMKLWPYPETSFIPYQRHQDVIYLSDDCHAPVGKAISGFSFKDTFYKVEDWSDMIREMISILFSMDPSCLYREAKDPDNVWFLTTQEKDEYYKVADGLYFTTHSSTSCKMRILKNLFKRYMLDEDELFFHVMEYGESSETEGVKEKRRAWLISANEKFFRIIDWWKCHDHIYWHQSLNYCVGDLVYLYICSPIAQVRYLCEVEEINLETYDEAEEKPYLLQPDMLSTSDKKYARFKLLSATENGSALSLAEMKNHGLNGAPIRGIILSSPLLEYIESQF